MSYYVLESGTASRSIKSLGEFFGIYFIQCPPFQPPPHQCSLLVIGQRRRHFDVLEVVLVAPLHQPKSEIIGAIWRISDQCFRKTARAWRRFFPNRSAGLHELWAVWIGIGHMLPPHIPERISPNPQIGFKILCSFYTIHICPSQVFAFSQAGPIDQRRKFPADGDRSGACSPTGCGKYRPRS